MNSKEFSKGDILEATDKRLNKGYHKIIYYEGNSNINFIGCMITHSDNEHNVKMSDQHFKKKDNNNNPYKIVFNDTYLVKGKFIKPEEWGPFTKVGCLTGEGVVFVENTIGNLPGESFTNYYRRNKIIK